MQQMRYGPECERLDWDALDRQASLDQRAQCLFGWNA
jgi:hypothetical protein